MLDCVVKRKRRRSKYGPFFFFVPFRLLPTTKRKSHNLWLWDLAGHAVLLRRKWNLRNRNFVKGFSRKEKFPYLQIMYLNGLHKTHLINTHTVLGHFSSHTRMCLANPITLNLSFVIPFIGDCSLIDAQQAHSLLFTLFVRYGYPHCLWYPSLKRKCVSSGRNHHLMKNAGVIKNEMNNIILDRSAPKHARARNYDSAG